MSDFSAHFLISLALGYPAGLPMAYKHGVRGMRANLYRYLLAGFAVLVGMAPVSWSQTGASQQLKLRGVEAKTTETPEYDVRVKGAGGSNQGKGEWLEVRAEFDTAPRWVNEVTFKYYVLMEAKSAEDVPKKNNLFTGSVTYVNIPKGNRYRSAIYLDPFTHQRYGQVKAVAVEVVHEGRTVDMKTDAKVQTKWWEQIPNPINGLLLNKNDTPFAFVDYDEYPMIKRKSVQ
jgi:hypothetical protein